MIKFLKHTVLYTAIIASWSLTAQKQDVSYWYHRSIDSIDPFYRLSDSLKHKVAEQFLTRAKHRGNPAKISEAYIYKLLANSHTQKASVYGDSSIVNAQKAKLQHLLGLSYMHKGIQLYYIENFSKALENYLKAHAIFTKEEHPYYQMKLKHYIGLLKLYTDEVEEANRIFEENLGFFKEFPYYINSHTNQYFKALYALSVSYRELKRITKSIEICELVFTDKKIKKSYLYPYFLHMKGALEDMNKNYKSALKFYKKSFSKYSPSSINDISTTLYDISVAYEKLGNTTLALKYFEKIDSLYQIHPEVIEEALKANFKLYQYYKATNNQPKQLEKLNNFISIDSILQLDRKNINNRILADYEVKPLIKEKKRLIEQLQDKNQQKVFLIWTLSLVGLILSLLITYKISILRLNKKRFDKLMASESNTSRIEPEKIQQDVSIDGVTSGLSDKTKNKILQKINHFESQKLFLTKKYTLVSLAKELGTNSSYLSKIINDTKQCNFANYLNQLKINYAIERLKTDEKFRNYTIKAIAEEAGFYNSQSFSSAFYKETGLYPSYFIKQLTKQLKT